MNGLAKRINRIEKQHAIEHPMVLIPYANPETHAEALERFTHEEHDFNPHVHPYAFVCLNEAYQDFPLERQHMCDFIISLFQQRRATYQALKQSNL